MGELDITRSTLAITYNKGKEMFDKKPHHTWPSKGILILIASLLIILIQQKLSFADIDDGLTPAEGEFPAIVLLADFSTSLSICSGTLIGPSTIITAAHCQPANLSSPNQFAFIRTKHLSPKDLIFKDLNKSQTSLVSIGVKSFFRPPEYDQLNTEYNETLRLQNELIDKINQATSLQNSANNKLNPTVSISTINKYIKQLNQLQKMSLKQHLVLASFDYGIIELQTPAPIDQADVAQLVCNKSLRKQAPIMMAGFGINMMAKGVSSNTKDQHQSKSAEKDIASITNGNENYNLLYGYNVLQDYLSDVGLYIVQKSDKTQIINHGDSGSPLMLKGYPGYILGISSSAINKTFKDPRTNIAIFNSTASANAKRFYQEVLSSDLAARETKNLLQTCLNEK